MELLTLLVADYASISEDHKLNVMGVFSEINCKGFPAITPQMVVVTKFAASAAEANTTRKLNIRLINEDGTETLTNFTRDIVVKQPIPGRKYTVGNILRIHNVVFRRAGTYAISVLVDGDEKGSTPLFVQLAPS